MTDGPQPVPRLRRDPDPQPTSGRRVLIGVAVFFLLLVGFVLTLVFTIGVHNSGVKFPPLPNLSTTPTAAAVQVPPFFAIDANTGAAAYVTPGATYRSQHHHQRAVAMAVARYGRTAYFAVPISGCRTVIYAMHAGRAITTRRVAVVDGHATSDPMALSADDTRLAFVVKPPSRNRATCATAPFVYAFDLRSRHLSVVERTVAQSPVSLAWVPKAGLATLVGGTITERRVGCLSCPPLFTGDADGPLGALLIWKGRLAAVSDGVLRDVDGASLGPPLATGLPDSVVAASVDTTGGKLLLWGGLQTVKDPGDISFRTTYVWSGGHSTYVPGEWIDPAW